MLLEELNNKIEKYIFLFVFFAIVTIIYQYVGNGTRPGDIGDSLYSIYVIESFFKNISEGKSLLEHNYMYPMKNNVFYSETMWGSAYIYSFFRFLNIDIFTSYNYYYSTISILNFFISFYFIRKFNLSFASSIIAAFIFAFSIPVFSQDIRPHLNARFYTPPCFYYFYTFLTSKDLKYLASSLTFLFLQFLCSMYHGIFLITILLSTYFIFFINKGKINYVDIIYINIFKKYNPKNLLALFALLFAFLILFYFYFDISIKYELGRSYPADHLIHPFAFLSSERIFPLNQFRILPENYSLGEMQLYMGLFIFPTLLFFFRKKVFKSLSFFEKNIFQITLINILIYISIFSISIYLIIYFIPGFSSIRAPSRSFLITLFPLSIFIAQILDKLKKKWKKSWFIIIFLLIFEPVYANKTVSDINVDKKKINLIIKKINDQHSNLTKDDVLVFKHYGDYVLNYHNDLYNILASLKLRNNTYNGYTSFTPTFITPFIDCEKFSEYLIKLKNFHQNKKILTNEIKFNHIKFIGFNDNCHNYLK